MTAAETHEFVSYTCIYFFLHSRSADLYALTACKGTVSKPAVNSPGQLDLASCKLGTAVISLLLLPGLQSTAVYCRQ